MIDTRSTVIAHHGRSLGVVARGRDGSVRRRTSRGLTLIELLTVVGIVALLLAILLPAVFMARRSVRLTQCQNNLRQIGLAMASYHNDHGCLPGYIVNRYTPFARCLPYIDQQVLFDALNFSIEPGSPENSTAASRRIEQFLCPDRASPDATDGPRPKPVGRPDVETAGCSYAVNIGSGDWDKHEDGPFRVGVACRWADIVDGLAATGLASEIVAGGEARGRFRGYLVETKNVGSEAAFLQDCLAADPASRPRSALGTSWISDGIFSTPYNHSLTPNQRGCEATNSPLYRCAFTASSLHEPTVNLLMADGSVRPVDESIAGTLWRSIGSRNGGEVQ